MIVPDGHLQDTGFPSTNCKHVCERAEFRKKSQGNFNTHARRTYAMQQLLQNLSNIQHLTKPSGLAFEFAQSRCVSSRTKGLTNEVSGTRGSLADATL